VPPCSSVGVHARSVAFRAIFALDPEAEGRRPHPAGGAGARRASIPARSFVFVGNPIEVSRIPDDPSWKSGNIACAMKVAERRQSSPPGSGLAARCPGVRVRIRRTALVPAGWLLRWRRGVLRQHIAITDEHTDHLPAADEDLANASVSAVTDAPLRLAGGHVGRLFNRFVRH